MPVAATPVSAAMTEATTSTRWIQLVLGVIAMMSISSPQYVWTLFTKSFQDNLHTTLPAIQITFSIVIVLQTWLSPLQGYLIDKFGVSTQTAQLYLFIFLAANAVGAFFGGPLGDRFGRKYVIRFSILGALPFSLALPYAGLFGSAVLTIFIGLIISSATSSIIVFAQELMPHRFGMISGMFFGVAFGIGGLGAAVLGRVADHTGIAFVYQVCAFLPAIGLLAVFLPKMPRTAH